MNIVKIFASFFFLSSNYALHSMPLYCTHIHTFDTYIHTHAHTNITHEHKSNFYYTNFYKNTYRHLCVFVFVHEDDDALFMC